MTKTKASETKLPKRAEGKPAKESERSLVGASAGRSSTRKARLVGERLEAVLQTAADVFVEQGFDKANYNEICKRSAISKASLYGLFPTKQDLFLGVLDHRMRALTEQMSMETIPSDMPVAEALESFGDGLLTSVLSDAQVELIRTISTVVPRLPELGRKFFASGPALGTRSLTHYLAEKVQSGELQDIDPPDLMTRVFINMAIDGVLYRKLLGVVGPQSRASQKAQVARAVEIFFRLYAMPDVHLGG